MMGCTNIKDWNKYLFIFPFLLLFFMSCKRTYYPVGKPYMSNSSVNLKIDVPTERRKEMELELYNYMDDSLKVQTKYIIGVKKQVSAPVFDSANIQRSKVFMKNYLNSLGYYRANFDTVKIKFDSTSKEGHVKTEVVFNITAGKQLKFDSIWYDLKVPELEKIALETKNKTLMRKGEGYSKAVVGQELDRLVSLYRNAGYFKIARNNLVAEFDSTDQALVTLDVDPFALIEQARRRRLNPTVDFRIFQRDTADAASYLKYKIGRMTVYPESSLDADLNAVLADKSFIVDTGKRSAVTVKYKKGTFTPRTVRRMNTILPGNYYSEEEYYKTVNAYSQVGSWQQVDVRANTYVDSTDTIPKVDISLFLTPAKRYSSKIDFEASQNIGKSATDVLTGSFVGFSLVGSLLDRNFVHNAIQWNSNVRGGVEINTGSTTGNAGGIFQNILLSGGTTFSIPRLWPPFRQLIKRPTNSRTFLSINGSYNDRKDFYQLRNANISLGFEWKKYNTIWTVKIPNVEFVGLDRSAYLDDLIKNNPSIAYAFNKGLVLSTIVGVQKNISYRNKPNQNSYARVTGEVATSFAKIDGELRHNIIYSKSKWAFRVIGGIGAAYKKGDRLPFYRQFIAGGPNSMRAWRLRQLGLGNSLMQDTAQFTDRLGDIYFEANAEYRFHMFKLLDFPMEGAFFTDWGNIWSRKSTTAVQGDGVFTFQHFIRDLGVAAGYGIRWDFSYLRVRVDIAYKVKDPVRGGQGWLKEFEYKTPNRLGNLENKNYAIQFGIDYPF